MLIRLLKRVRLVYLPQRARDNFPRCRIRHLLPVAGWVGLVPFELPGCRFLETVCTSGGSGTVDGTEEAEECLGRILVRGPFASDEFGEIGGYVGFGEGEGHFEATG